MMVTSNVRKKVRKAVLPSRLVFVPIAPQRAFEEIAAQIRTLIATGKLKPGDRLPAERALAVAFKVSRNSLREAFRALELSGVIELKKGATGGAFVLPGSSGAIVTGMRDLYHLGAITPEQITEARVWLSEIIVREACRRATEGDLLALEENVKAAASAEKAGNFEERAAHHLQFHTLLAKINHNPIFQITMEAVLEVMGLFIAQIGPSENPYTLPSRRRLLKHLRARDEKAAVAEMSKFLSRLQAQYLEKAARP
jgi:GntR family transcriptional regulator, transcriptional repressor for pyruvate dehydrogenase complex